MLTKKQYKKFISKLLGLSNFLNGNNLVLKEKGMSKVDKNYLVSICEKNTKNRLYYIIVDNDDYSNNTYKTSNGKTFDTNDLLNSIPKEMGDSIFIGVKRYP